MYLQKYLHNIKQIYMVCNVKFIWRQLWCHVTPKLRHTLQKTAILDLPLVFNIFFKKSAANLIGPCVLS